MNKIWPPQDQVFWYLQRNKKQPCRTSQDVEVVVIGGGMAGLSAAQAFAERGKKVLLLEQYYCGSGASGKSSGFITPNAELSFTDFTKRHGIEGATTLWNFITGGVERIRHNITTHSLVCDYSLQDTLVLANTKSALATLQREHENLAKAGYKTSIYTAGGVMRHIGSDTYAGGFGYPNTFGIDGYAYCQQMKNVLEQSGVTICEETPVLAIEDHTVKTAHADINANYIIVCTDRFMPKLGLLKQDVFHAQTYLMVSQVLTDEEINLIFPQARYMVWDTDMIYNYFRVTGQNRLLLGGGNLLSTYAKPRHDYWPMVRKLTNYLNHRFPRLRIQFEQQWSGLIGISKDIAPLAGPDRDRPYLFYVAAAAGLPIAAALGRYSADYVLDGNSYLDPYFSPYRRFPIGGIVQSALGTKLSFALSNLFKMNIP